MCAIQLNDVTNLTDAALGDRDLQYLVDNAASVSTASHRRSQRLGATLPKLQSW